MRQYMNKYLKLTDQGKIDYLEELSHKYSDMGDFYIDVYYVERDIRVRSYVTLLISDLDFLKDIARSDSNEIIRQQAIGKIRDKDIEFLDERLKLDHSPLVRNFIKTILRDVSPALRFIKL